MTTRDIVSPTTVASCIDTSFQSEIVREVLTGGFLDSKTKLSAESLALVCEVARLLVAETAARASAQAQRDAAAVVDIEHVEKCLPQLMLDFP